MQRLNTSSARSHAPLSSEMQQSPRTKPGASLAFANDERSPSTAERAYIMVTWAKRCSYSAIIT